MPEKLTRNQVKLCTEIGVTLDMYTRERARFNGAHRPDILTRLGVQLKSLLKRAKAYGITAEPNFKAAELLMGSD